MKRVTTVAFAAATLLATTAFAEPPQAPAESNGKTIHARDARPRYANTRERWRGRPHLRSAGAASPLANASETVYEHVPSVNFMLEGQFGGAFNLPPSAPISSF